MKKKTRPAKEKSKLKEEGKTREIFYSWSEILLGLKTPAKR